MIFFECEGNHVCRKQQSQFTIYDLRFTILNLRLQIGDFRLTYNLLLTTHPSHSVLKLFTGFAVAAFIAWYKTVISAIPHAEMPAIANTHHCRLIW